MILFILLLGRLGIRSVAINRRSESREERKRGGPESNASVHLGAADFENAPCRVRTSAASLRSLKLNSIVDNDAGYLPSVPQGDQIEGPETSMSSPITIKNLTGTSFTVDVDPVTTTVDALKGLIAALGKGKSVQPLALAFKGHELRDTRKLEYYGIVTQDTIHIRKAGSINLHCRGG